ncbi:MAG: redoxin domain-containing protein [Chitinophagaceae bacterium]|jgi:peroxiredoxin|nr:redoxin domain-containing protein [Chitinophagaceae bacterium]OQY92000.1 MAG: hypothetical protein B6D37_15320 [Sphingobacteriales bacterium UTBCD1]
MLQKGDTAPEISADSINNQHISLSSMKGKKVLLKFHRFSGCPIAQNQISELIKRQPELNAAGIESIVFMYSSPGKIISNYTEVPGLHIIGDKQKMFYKLYDSRFSSKKIFNWPTWKNTFIAIRKGYFPLLSKFGGGITGVPSDFLIDENGKIKESHYGKHFGDSWNVSQVLDICK